MDPDAEGFPMGKRKIGIFLILVGFFIPSILYPFSTLTPSTDVMRMAFAAKGVQYSITVTDLELVLKEGEYREYKSGGGSWEGRIAIPYRYILAFGVVICFVGIGILAFSPKKKTVIRRKRVK